MDSKLEEVLAGARDVMTVKRVFGEPYQQNGVTVIPAASVFGGGGGGEGTAPGDAGGTSGVGTGFGLIARPAGAYVIKGDDVSWQPALDLNRLATGALVFLTLRVLLRRRRN